MGVGRRGKAWSYLRSLQVSREICKYLTSSVTEFVFTLRFRSLSWL